MATPHNNPPAPHDRIGAQRGKCTARILRRLGLAVALAIVCAGLYLACIGLPRTVARHLVNHLRAHGFDVQAARIRLSWRGTLVAEKVNVTSAGTWPHLSFSARSVELQPVCTALIRPRFVVRRLRVQDGTMHCLVRAGELPPKELSFHDLHLQTEFYGLDRWIIRTCRTEFAAIKLQLNGALTNVSALLGRERPAPEKTAAQLESSLWKLAALLEQLRLEGVTKVHLDFMADAAKPETFNGLVAIAVQGVETPWLKLSDATLSLRVNGLRDDSAGPAATLRARAARAECTWGTVSNASLEVNWTVYDPACTILSADLALSARALGTKHFAAEQLELTAQCLHSLTNLLPDSGSARLCVAELSTKFGEAANAKASLQFRSVGAGAASAPPPRLMWLERFASLAVAAELELDQIASTNLPLNSLACELAWNAPSLVITNIAARFGTGEARSWLGLDTSTGRAEFGFDSNFDIRQLARLLPENTRQWLAKFDWASPPMLVGRGAAILPDWTSPQADWRTQFRAGLVASGRFELGTVSYRGITADAAAGSFCYSNSCWHVPDLRVSFPSGTVLVNIVSSDLTRELRCHLEGPITPEILRPVLGESAARQLDLLVLTQPAHIELDMTSARGEKLPHTARGRIAITNFTFRSERISEFCTELVYSNQLLRLLRPSAKRDEQFATAESIEIDIGTKQVRLYNASGRADPMVVARAIGPKTERAIAPYRFLTPPDVRVTGTVPFRGTRGTDLVFDINGGPFQWQRFNMARARSTVHWVDERVELIVAEAEFYGGKLGGKAQFD
ncbi:MAG: hypothetical protein RMH97_02515, partial [Verrucomicrobiales bacterium]|nr:hypothetical protein [Verrucomicrobiales bacterium]